MTMKNKWLIFSSGIIIGILLTFCGFFIASKTLSKDDGITWFDKPGKVIEVKAFEVFQVIYDDAALVHGQKYEDMDIFSGTVYLLTNENGKLYYDDEIVKVPAGKKVRQVGVFQYQTRMSNKTVPIIQIMSE